MSARRWASLATLAGVVLAGSISLGQAPARADGDCGPARIDISGPNPGYGTTTIFAQPTGAPVTLTLEGSDGSPVQEGCPLDLGVRWSTGGHQFSTDDQVTVSSDSIADVTYDVSTYSGFMASVTIMFLPAGQTVTQIQPSPVPTVEQPTQFSATAVGDYDVLGWTWDFGDGESATTGADPAVTHTYHTAGDHTVTATVTDSTGATGSLQQTVHVNAPLSTDFTAPGSVPLGAAASFAASAATDPTATITTYAWDFADGNLGSGGSVQHLFRTTGTYPVTVTTTDSLGRTATATHDVTVAPVQADARPVAAFISTTARPVAGSPVTFDGSTSTDPDGTVTGYAWDFGDGVSATGASASHPYTAAGTYQVTLTVTDDSGRTATVTHPVTVAPSGYPATDLAVSIAGSTPKAGQYSYRVKVTNLGHAAAHDVVLLDTPDTTQTLVTISTPAALHCSGVPIGATGTITCKSGTATLAAGKSWVVTVTVRQPTALRTVRTLVDTAQVRAANPDGVTRNNAARLTTTVAARR